MTLRRKLSIVAGSLLVLAAIYPAWKWMNRRHPVKATEIFQGVTYGCDQIATDESGHGLAHWVKIDLTAPGIELYVTPLDPDALAVGWQYRLRSTAQVVRQEGLAVGINACLFSSDSWGIPLPGEWGRSVETVIADHQVSHVWEHTYLLWFEDDLTPHQEFSKPPSEEVLQAARWAVGGQGVALKDGKIIVADDAAPPDANTVIGIDPDRKLLFLAVFEYVTPARAMEKLANLGARHGMVLDGGDSTSMVLAKSAARVRPGTLLSGWRIGQANHLGVRAKPLAER